MDKISGIVLSGGKSSRMGEDKALLKVGTKSIIELMIDKLKPFCDEIIISTDDTEKYSQFGYKVVTDKFKDSGPLAGIYSSLLKSNSERNFVISCDLPLVSQKIIGRLINYNSSKEIIIPVTDGKYNQLCGIYCKSILKKAEDILMMESGEGENERIGEEENGRSGETEKGGKRNTSIKRLLNISEVEFVDVTAFAGKNEFLNMNSLAEFSFLKDHLLNNYDDFK